MAPKTNHQPPRRSRKSNYESPAVIASFARSELAEDLPEVITPHIHSSQSS